MDAKTRNEILAMSWQEAPVNGALPSSAVLASLPAAAFSPVVQPVVNPQPVGAADVWGLIPYVGFLMSGWDRTCDSSSVTIVETCQRVYLCKFQLIDHPDPVLPIAGLAWWQAGDFKTRAERLSWRWLQNAYGTAGRALARHGDRGYLNFRRDMAGAVNFLLAFFSRAPETHMTMNEYAFTARHLTEAMRRPERYR